MFAGRTSALLMVRAASETGLLINGVYHPYTIGSYMKMWQVKKERFPDLNRRTVYKGKNVLWD